jgi:hypothetical protein
MRKPFSFDAVVGPLFAAEVAADAVDRNSPRSATFAEVSMPDSIH